MTLENWHVHVSKGLMQIWGFVGDMNIIIVDLPIQTFISGDTVQTTKNTYILGERSEYLIF